MGSATGQRVILLGSARTYRTEAFTAAAARLGAEVVTGDDVPLPMLARTPSALPLDYRDLVRSTEAIVRFADTHPVAAILGVDDSGTVLAARACAALGLSHNDPEAAQAARSKHVMRCRFAEAGVPSPRFSLHHVGDDPAKLAASATYPCVLKPTLLSGSRGVMRADTPAEFVERFARLARILAGERCDEVLVEEYIPGVEVALEGLMQEGHLRVLALFDKPDPLEGPFFEETLYVTPSRLPPQVQQAVADAAGHAAVALGLFQGPVHAELRINDRGPWLVEVAARSIGGLCSKTLRFGTDMSLEELILRQALRMEIGSLASATRAGGVLMIPIPRAGILRGVHGIEAAQAVPLVESVEITARTSYPLLPLPEGDSYLGFVFARGDGPEEVEAALRAAHACLRFDIVPEMKVAASARRDPD
jgi:biotin carboxylase